MIKIWISVFLFVLTLNIGAEVKTETVEYKCGDEVMEGYLAYDDAVKAKRPGVLVIHDWTGIGKFAKQKTEDLAKMGYLAFAADIYGKGVRPKDPKEYLKKLQFHRRIERAQDYGLAA